MQKKILDEFDETVVSHLRKIETLGHLICKSELETKSLYSQQENELKTLAKIFDIDYENSTDTNVKDTAIRSLGSSLVKNYQRVEP